MTTADEFFAQAQKEKPADEAPPTIKRDRWGRPLIIPPGGGKPEPYIRVSTLAGALDDKTALGDWKARMTGLGVARSQDLVAAFGSIQDPDDPEQKRTANELAEQAQERAKSSAKRIMGTGFHTLTETLDKGQEPTFVPEALRPLFEDYRRKTADITWRAIEQFVVVDEVKAAGTADRVGQRPGEKPRVFDVKTGRVDYGELKFAVQLACYARGMFYNPATGERRPWPEIDLEVGYILHADPATGIVTPYEVDIAAGWEAAKVARHVYGLRKAKVMKEVSWGPAQCSGSYQRNEGDHLCTCVRGADCAGTHACACGFVWPPQVSKPAAEQVRRPLNEPLSEERGIALRESLIVGEPRTIMQALAHCTELAQISHIYQQTGQQWEPKHRHFADFMAGQIRKAAS